MDETPSEEQFLYQVTGFTENVYAALVVLLGYTNTFTRTNQWHNQAQYEMKPGHCCGFKMTLEQQGELELVLYYGRETPPPTRLLFQGLFETFLAARNVNVVRYPAVICPSCSYRQQRDEVVKRIRLGKGFLFCGECGDKISLPISGEEIRLTPSQRGYVIQSQTVSRLRTAFEAALVRVKSVARNRHSETPSCFISYAWGRPLMRNGSYGWDEI